MRKIVILLTVMASFIICCAFDIYKPKGTGGIIGRDVGYEQHLLTTNKWLITFHAGLNTEKSKAWSLLYKRIEEFGKLKCPNGYNIIHQETDYEYIGDNSTTVARAILECK